MATLNVIRRWALREQMSIREIARRTGLARNTVKKYLRSEESEPRYARRVSSSKLDPYAEKLAGWLVTEATKSRKQRRTLRQIHTPIGVIFLKPEMTVTGSRTVLQNPSQRRRRSVNQIPGEHLVLTIKCGSGFDGSMGSGFSRIEQITVFFSIFGSFHPARWNRPECVAQIHLTPFAATQFNWTLKEHRR